MDPKHAGVHPDQLCLMVAHTLDSRTPRKLSSSRSRTVMTLESRRTQECPIYAHHVSDAPTFARERQAFPVRVLTQSLHQQDVRIRRARCVSQVRVRYHRPKSRCRARECHRAHGGLAGKRT